MGGVDLADQYIACYKLDFKMSNALDLMGGNTVQQVTANTDYLTCLPPPESAEFIPDRIRLDPPNYFAKWDLNTKGEKTKYRNHCREKGCNSNVEEKHPFHIREG